MDTISELRELSALSALPAQSMIAEQWRRYDTLFARWRWRVCRRLSDSANIGELAEAEANRLEHTAQPELFGATP